MLEPLDSHRGVAVAGAKGRCRGPAQSSSRTRWTEFAAFRDFEKIFPLKATSFSSSVLSCLFHTLLGSGESPVFLLNNYHSDVSPGSRSGPRLALEQAGDNRPDSIPESPLA